MIEKAVYTEIIKRSRACWRKGRVVNEAAVRQPHLPRTGIRLDLEDFQKVGKKIKPWSSLDVFFFFMATCYFIPLLHCSTPTNAHPPSLLTPPQCLFPLLTMPHHCSHPHNTHPLSMHSPPMLTLHDSQYTSAHHTQLLSILHNSPYPIVHSPLLTIYKFSPYPLLTVAH